MTEGVKPGGTVLELGAGTGVFTKALLDRGVKAADIVLVEREERFVPTLREMAPDAELLNDDAFALAKEWADGGQRFDVVVSGLPFLNFPKERALELRNDLLRCLNPGGWISQITYGPKSPIALAPVDGMNVSGHRTKLVWRNLPPAHIWRYSLGVAN
ncbi:MAG: methyltransferase domain-containing protein [Pseudomonadota bacterium]